MRPEGAKHEAIRLLYHLWGDWPAVIASEFGMKPRTVYKILRKREVGPKYRPTKKHCVSGQNVFDCIAQNGPLSRRDIQSIYSLSKTAILRRLTALQEQGRIARDGRKYVVIS